MERRPPPISLRLRHAEVTQRARALLHRLAEDDRLQRRIRWQATKALIATREMAALAANRVAKMSPGERARWQTECKQFESFLKKIKSGVY